MAKVLSTQNVVGTLSAAGFVAMLRTRRTYRRGYKVTKGDRSIPDARGAVLVWADHPPEGEDHAAYSARLETALVAAGGFEVDRPFPDKTILRVRWAV